MRRLPASLISLSALVLSLLVLFAAGLQGASAGTTVQVDTNADNPALVACTLAPNDCSLRGAIISGNISGGPTTIELQNNTTYTLTGLAGDNVNLGGDLDIETPTAINGHGSTIDADDLDRVVDIDADPGVLIVLSDLTITGGHITDGSIDELGGGIRLTGGNLSLNNVTVQSNDSMSPGGGIGVAGDSSLTVTSSTFGGNMAAGRGGGIFKGDGAGDLMITGSTFNGNTGAEGGGVLAGISGTAQITNTNFNGNSATIDCGVCFNGGGAIFQGAGEMTITGGSFNGNDSASSGGAMLLNDATVSNVGVSGNTAAGVGGGIAANRGTINNATITGNTAAAAGGVYTFDGTVSQSAIIGNTATNLGGGVIIAGGGSLDHSEVTGNTATGNAGGVAIRGEAPSISNSTITGNTAAQGGGIYRMASNESLSLGGVNAQGGPFPGTATLSFLTLVSNTAGSGANVYDSGSLGPIHIGGSIIGFSGGAGSDCNVPLTSDGYNVEEGTSCSLDSSGDISGVDPGLGPLQNNGGPTRTRALIQGSPAIDSVPAADCPASGDDQRGTARPIGTNCDSGAYESSFGTGASASPSPTMQPSSTPSSTTKVWGDEDCGNDADNADLLELLRFASGVELVTRGCFPAIGETVQVDGTARKWGDINCSGDVDAGDPLTQLIAQSGLTPTVGSGCPSLEQEVAVSP